MRNLKQSLALATLVALVGGLAVVAPAQAAAGLSTEAQYILDETNDYRLSQGRSPLTEDSALNAVAQAYAEEMAATAAADGVSAAFHHNPNLKSQIPSGWTYVGENIAWNKGWPDPKAKLMSQWIASTGHRENMINKEFTHVGVGYFTDSTGTWGVQVFTQYNYDTNYPVITLTVAGGDFVDGDTASISLGANYPIDAKVAVQYRVNGGSWNSLSGGATITDGEGTVAVPVKGDRDYRVKHLGVYSSAVDVVGQVPVITLDGGGDFFRGVPEVIAVTVDPATTGKGYIYIKKNNRSWQRLDTRIYFTDGEGSKTLKPKAATTRYKVKINGQWSNIVTFTRVIPEITLTATTAATVYVASGSGDPATVGMTVQIDPDYTGPVKVRYRKPGGSWRTYAWVDATDGQATFTVNQTTKRRVYQVVFAGGKSEQVLVTRLVV